VLCWWRGIGGLTRSGIDSGSRWGRQGHCARLAKLAPSASGSSRRRVDKHKVGLKRALFQEALGLQ